MNLSSQITREVWSDLQIYFKDDHIRVGGEGNLHGRDIPGQLRIKSLGSSLNSVGWFNIRTGNTKCDILIKVAKDIKSSSESLSDASHSGQKNLHHLYHREAEGLLALKKLATKLQVALQVPTVMNSRLYPEMSYLLMEYYKESLPSELAWRTLGEELARLHQGNQGTQGIQGNSSSQQYGFHANNYIGITPQKNSWNSNWSEFFWKERIHAQLKMANRYGVMGNGEKEKMGLQKLEARIKQLLPENPRASLLHGDLWQGNVFFTEQAFSEQAFTQQAETGTVPVLIDPAVYYGHYEADLAMSELFGGFNSEFYRGYFHVQPMEKGYEVRKKIYNLYHLLNHLNLFGTGYLGQVKNTINYLLDL